MNYIKINCHSQLKFLLPVFIIHYSMFQPDWPSSDNNKNKVLGKLIETSSSIK